MRMNRPSYILLFLLLCILLLVLCTGSVTEPLKSNGHAEEQPQHAADLFTSPSCCPYCIIVGLVGGLASGFVCAGVAFIVRKCKKSKNTFQAELQEKFQTRDKLDSVVYRIINLKYLKKTLENQRDQCRLQLEDVERKRGENKEKLQSVETFISESDREKATDKTERYLREKQILLNAQRELEKRKEELEKLQLDTEKVLQSKDAVDNLSRLKERKRELEILIE
ncbi:mRNA export factor GLE1-like [Thunnus thynnus]|uniref:mRNA export factor GLE1-like n=1 Tax=Thunnus thynnus TaxID=8237 RepID=UPI0035270885